MCNTPIPLYSEEQAVSFLREKGYEVKEPPKPRKGKIIIYQYKTGNGSVTYAKNKTEWDSKSQFYRDARTIIAIVDWTEGQGI